MGGKLVRRRIRIYQFTMRRRPAGRRSQTDASGVRHGRIFRKVTAVTYDAGGNQLTVRDPNNVVADMVYDSLGRNTQRTVTFGDVSLTETRSSGRHYRNDNLLSGISYSNTNIGNLGYSWDATGNKTAETIGGVMSGYGFTSAGTAYDDEDRLTGYQRAATSGSALLAQSWALTSVGDWCPFCIGPPRLNRDLIEPLVKLRLCCDLVRTCMPLASCQGRLTIYSREMVNIPRDKLEINSGALSCRRIYAASFAPNGATTS